MDFKDLLDGSVRRIQAGDVHASGNQGLDRLGAIRRRTDSGDDLRAPGHAAILFNRPAPNEECRRGVLERCQSLKTPRAEGSMASASFDCRGKALAFSGT